LEQIGKGKGCHAQPHPSLDSAGALKLSLERGGYILVFVAFRKASYSPK
jgi:hypothetical protein